MQKKTNFTYFSYVKLEVYRWQLISHVKSLYFTCEIEFHIWKCSFLIHMWNFEFLHIKVSHIFSHVKLEVYIGENFTCAWNDLFLMRYVELEHRKLSQGATKGCTVIVCVYQPLEKWNIKITEFDVSKCMSVLQFVSWGFVFFSTILNSHQKTKFETSHSKR